MRNAFASLVTKNLLYTAPEPQGNRAPDGVPFQRKSRRTQQAGSVPLPPPPPRGWLNSQSLPGLQAAPSGANKASESQRWHCRSWWGEICLLSGSQFTRPHGTFPATARRLEISRESRLNARDLIDLSLPITSLVSRRTEPPQRREERLQPDTRSGQIQGRSRVGSRVEKRPPGPWSHFHMSQSCFCVGVCVCSTTHTAPPHTLLHHTHCSTTHTLLHHTHCSTTHTAPPHTLLRHDRSRH